MDSVCEPPILRALRRKLLGLGAEVAALATT